MRILFINSARSIGGGERHGIDLASELARRGHHVHWVVRDGAAVRRLIDKTSSARVESLPLRNALDVQSALGLARLIKRDNIEIVHAHTARDYPLAACAAMLNPSTRLIVTRHLTRRLSAFHRVTFKRADKIIAVSNGVAASLHGLADAAKIAVIHNGININRFAAARRAYQSHRVNDATDDQTLVVGSIGELRPHKGHDDFLRAAALVARHHANLRFVICGADSTPEQINLRQLTTLAHELGIADQVEFQTWTDEPEKVFARLDIFVSAARVEPFGLVIVEAMACGLPVVATDTDGARDIFNFTSNDLLCNGLLGERNNPLSLAAHLGNLVASPELREKLSYQAYRTACDRFSVETMTDKIETLYRSVLPAKAARKHAQT